MQIMSFLRFLLHVNDICELDMEISQYEKKC